MPYRIEFERAAARALRRLAADVRERIEERIDRLAEDPRPRGAEMLEGEHRYWRLRVDQYRIIYEIWDDELVVLIVDAGHRRDIYQRLRRLRRRR